MGKLFGTDGVRGIANKELTADLAFKLGQAGAMVLTKHAQHKPKIIIGKDTRASSSMLECAMASGIASVGGEAILVGVVPTPAVAYIVRELQYDAGVVISASHNPVEFNGIKFFNKDGFKLSDAIEEEIEDIILNNKELPAPTGAQIGHVTQDLDAVRHYIKYIPTTIQGDLLGLKMVIDCANGANSYIAEQVLRDMGVQVISINDIPDGTNINKDCGSTHLGDLKKAVLENKADLGIAFDGDADRCLAVDENGELVSGDKILAICGKFLKDAGKLPNNTIVATIMSNLGLSKACENLGINLVQAKVGDRYVLEEMQKGGYVLGGEESGHIIFLKWGTTGDGLLTAVHLAGVLKKSGKKLSHLAKVMQTYPQIIVNAKVPNDKKHDYEDNADVKEAIERVRAKFNEYGRVVIRPSGTEPVIRVMIEGQDIEELTREANGLANVFEMKLG